MDNFIIAALAYLTGCLPFAYILFRFGTGNDLRASGTGNLGAMNSYESSGRRWIGIAVFFLDFLKGLVGIMLISHIFNPTSYGISLAAAFLVLGHNYNIFLKLKGGRGLSTAAGVFAAICPVVLAQWLLMWVSGYYAVKRNVHIANVLACAFSSLLCYLTPGILLEASSTFIRMPAGDMKLLFFLINMIILLRHVEPVRALLDEFKREA